MVLACCTQVYRDFVEEYNASYKRGFIFLGGVSVKELHNTFKLLAASLVAIMLVSSSSVTFVQGDNFGTGDQAVDGLFYEWGKEDSKYPFSTSEATSTSTSDTYGKFALSGSMSEMDEHDGTISYMVKKDTNVSFKYTYDDSMLSNNDQGDVNWHITNDNRGKIDNDSIDVGGKIESGAILIQTSLDGVKWIDDKIITNVFSTTPIQTGSIFASNDVQLMNGTFYRFIVVYRERRLVGSSGWFVFQSLQYEYRERAEVYKVYLESETAYYHEDNVSRQELGTTLNAGPSNGFSENNDLTSGDYQYGWDLGKFFVSGFSAKKQDSNGKYTFLKNVGDRVSLNYRLLQDINCLDGKDNLIINRDMDGLDSHFQTDKDVNFERGALIIRFTDYEGGQHTQVFTNFLEANTRTGADTRAYLFEEGDYEVALDYEICNTRWFKGYKNYRVFFEFSIRNGNCMVFPFDTITGSELDNLSETPNGFSLDLAGSRWLNISVTKYALNSSGTGLDSRFNKPSSEVSVYEEPGIYKIVVKNEDAIDPDASCTKIICVGNDYQLNRYFREKVVPNPSILDN